MGKIISADALVIGGGVTARRAAKIIAEKYNVILVSDGSGASPYIHGFNVPLLESDSTDLFYEDTMESGKWQNDPELETIISSAFISRSRVNSSSATGMPNLLHILIRFALAIPGSIRLSAG